MTSKKQLALDLLEKSTEEPTGAKSWPSKGLKLSSKRFVTIYRTRYRAMAYGCKSEVDMLCREVSILSRVGGMSLLKLIQRVSLDHPNVIGFIGAALDDKSVSVSPKVRSSKFSNSP